MRAKPLINNDSVQIVIEADSPLEMGLLKRFINGTNGNGESFGAGYSSDSSTYSYGYSSISLVSYEPYMTLSQQDTRSTKKPTKGNQEIATPKKAK